MDASDIKDLLRFVKNAGFHEVELEYEGFRMRVVKNPPAEAQSNAAPAQLAAPAPAVVSAVPAPPQPAPTAAPVAQAAPAAEAAPAVDPSLHEHKAPMVGTFYSSPKPDAPPFVQVGSQVTQGQTLCIIEAMKLMNEIEAEVAGTIVEILPSNGQPVEYGEPLFRIRPA